MRVEFVNEPAIDEGGVIKEYFQLLLKEIFNPDYAMFIFNPDIRMYWFNGFSFESPINFELIGTLLGLASSNQILLDIPILNTCYKVILGFKPNFDDLELWQPEVAKSLRYILDYDAPEPLEDVLMRTFTIDMESYGDKVTVELMDGGTDVLVTRENRKEFVDRYIEYLFETQCKTQLEAFKRGFFKFFEQSMLRFLYSPVELEQYCCGTNDLDFQSLRRIAKYIQPLHPKHEFVQWFWEIVLEEFTEDQKKKLLAFTTGSDRAPITGLEDMEFILGIEGDDEEKLPIAHTCFNQLILPNYKSKD